MAELVTDYLENALPWRTQLAARLHLGLCSACTHYFDQVRRTAAFLKSRHPPPPPGPIEDEILRRIGRVSPPP